MKRQGWDWLGQTMQIGGMWSMIPAMDHNFFAAAWLLIGLAWAYRSVTRKEYAGLLIAGGFILLAIAAFWQSH
jgi:hypothetical protein